MVLCLLHLAFRQLHEEAVWCTLLETAGKDWEITSPPHLVLSTSFPTVAEVFLSCLRTCLCRCSLTLSVKRNAHILHTFKQTLIKCVSFKLSSVTGLLQGHWTAEGHLFTHLHSNQNSLGKHGLCLQLQTPPTPTANYFRKWRESSQGKRKSHVVRGFSEMKKLSQQRCLHRQDG